MKECYGDQQMMGAKGGKGKPKPAPPERMPKGPMKHSGKRLKQGKGSVVRKD